MSWLSNFVRPKIRALVNPRRVRESLWEKCAECDQMIFHRELDERMKVCPHCGHHMFFSPEERLSHLFDNSEYEMLALPSAITDPLKFKDRKRYTDRLKEARSGNADRDAIIGAYGKLRGNPCVVCVLDFAFMAGSMGVAVGGGFLSAANVAVERRVPFVVFTASGGARMQEGALSLMQMPRTIVGLNAVKEAGLPYIVVLTNPTTGGVTASFAMLGDVTLAEPGALVGFAGPRVIEDTIREKLPDGFQRSEYLEDHGMVDRVIPRAELRHELGALLDLFMNKESTVSSPLPPSQEEFQEIEVGSGSVDEQPPIGN
ncbi:MAG: acetyl-CoA carboxylase, carboxyltransferase subunit beta [Pseudomonadota bacterium]|nr:acetyl-CoA carboxylase, carboxyltransferase subunit beta [Pseudomonadota bacterium]